MMLQEGGLEHRLSALSSNGVDVKSLITMEERDLHLLPLPEHEIPTLLRLVRGAKRHEHDAGAFFDEGDHRRGGDGDGDGDGEEHGHGDDLFARAKRAASGTARPSSPEQAKVRCTRCHSQVTASFQ